jgi:hypothetical protein
MMPVIQLTVPAPILSEDGLSDCSPKRSSVMTKFMLVAAILSLSIGNAEVARAQAAIGEPGLYAFYHPDGDVLRAGPNYTGSRAEPRNALAAAPVTRPAHSHRHGRTQ